MRGGFVSSLASWSLGSAGETETKADNGLLPSRAALADRCRACLGGLWGPLLFPVQALGLLASLEQAGSRAGHLPHPLGWPLKGRAVTTASGRSTQCSYPIFLGFYGLSLLCPGFFLCSVCVATSCPC